MYQNHKFFYFIKIIKGVDVQTNDEPYTTPNSNKSPL